MDAIYKNASLAASLSPERVAGELDRIILTDEPWQLYTLIDAGLLDRYLKKRLSRDNGLRAIARMPKKSVPRRAALCAVLLGDDCIASAGDFLRSLRSDTRSVRSCSAACDMLKGPAPSTAKEYKLLLRSYGVEAVECAALCWDALYSTGHMEALASVLKSGECFSVKYLAVNGADLMNLGLDGKQIGAMLDFLVDYVIDYPANNERGILLSIAAATEE